jgi:nitrite reductase (NADH) large subunit
MRERLVIVGHGMAAQRLLEELARLAPGRHHITVLGAEPRPAYNRILLSPLLAGERTADELALAGERWFREQGITLRSGVRVTGIDRAARRVLTAQGGMVPYDTLVLATGSDPIALPLPGAGLPGVVSFRDLADVEAMLSRARTGAPAVVIGGGLLGLEAASGLRKRGMAVTVVHRFLTLMERQLDHAASRVLQQTLERQGLRFRLACQARAILGQDGVEGVALDDGTRLPAHLVVMAAGIRPRVELARASGLHCEAGIVVDDALCTSDPRILALGECAQHGGRCYGLVAPLYEQAAVCARRLAGDAGARYEGSLESTTLKVSGVAVASLGRTAEEPKGGCIVFRDAEAGIYRRLLISGERLTGAILVGDTREAAWFGELIRACVPITAFREELIFGRAHAQAAGEGAAAPDPAIWGARHGPPGERPALQ